MNDYFLSLGLPTGDYVESVENSTLQNRHGLCNNLVGARAQYQRRVFTP